MSVSWRARAVTCGGEPRFNRADQTIKYLARSPTNRASYDASIALLADEGSALRASRSAQPTEAASRNARRYDFMFVDATPQRRRRVRSRSVEARWFEFAEEGFKFFFA